MKKYLIALAFALALGATASTVNADTNADIMAQIAALQAQLSTTSSAPAGHQFLTDLTVGSTGGDVTALQTLLESKGFLTIPAGVAKGYFGQLTKSAVAAWQASVGLPATGYFGPLSRAKVNGMTTTTTTTTTTTAPANCPAGFTCVSNTTTTTTTSGDGSEGQLDEVESIGGTDSSVEEGDEDSKVLGIQLKAEDSDMTLERVDVDFDLSDITTGSNNLNHYIDSVSLMLDGKAVETQDVDEGDEDDDVFSFRFTDLKSKITENKTSKLYVTVNAVSSIDSDDAGQDITVTVPDDGIRAVDEAGISDTYGDASELTDEFSVGERSEGDLDLTSDDDDNRTVSVDDEDTTDDVPLLTFELESQDQMNTVQEITVRIATTSGRASDIIETLYLFADGEEVGSESISAGGPSLASITFDDLDLEIDEDESIEFEVRADIAGVEDNYTNGATIVASVLKTGVDAEDEAGDDIDVSGSDVTGGTVTLRTSGVMVEDSTKTAEQALGLDNSTTDDQGKYTVKFTVSAFEDPAYVALSATRGTTIGGGVNYTLEDATNGYVATTTGTVSAELRHLDGGTEVGNYVKINDGQTATFELTVYYDAALTDIYRAQLYSVNFASTTVAADSRELVTPAEEFQTPGVQVKN